jgi:UDP-2,3-diacylglucosamine hydrolase
VHAGKRRGLNVLRSPAAGSSPLAIVCGGGMFPLAVADEVSRGGRVVFLIGIRGISNSAIERHPHSWLRMGAFGRMIEDARRAGARDILFVGGLTRPADWRELRPDARLLLLLPKLVRAFRGGDDRLLTALAEAVESAGLTVRGVHEVAPGLLIPAGPLGTYTPDPAALADAQLGLRVLDALSPHDVGQGLVVAGGRVLAVEAAEGTDLMLARVAELRSGGKVRVSGRGGVFVKAPKLGQDRRMDTPAIGPATVARVSAAGLAGIAVAAAEVMAVDAETMVADADHAGIFIAGLAGVQP